MMIVGRVENGVVKLSPGSSLPEGTEVTVVVRPAAGQADSMSEAELNRRRQALARLVALPDENPVDSFSGANHDEALYGERA